MLNLSLFWRIYSGFILVVLLFAVVISLQLGKQVEESRLQDVEESLNIQAELLAAQYQQGFDTLASKQLQKNIILLGKKTQTRITLIDADGKVVADVNESPEHMDNHAKRPELIEAQDKSLGKAIRYSHTLQTNMLYLARKISKDSSQDSSKGNGFIRVSVALDDVEQQVASLRRNIYVSAALSLLVCLLLGFYFSKRFSDPLKEMTVIAEEIAKGDYSRRIHLPYQDEIGRLANALNRMAGSAEKRVEELVEDKNKLATILSGMVEGVVAVDENEKVIHLNEAAARLLNTSIKSSMGRSVWDIVRAPEIHQVLKGVLAEGSVKHQQAKLSGVATDTIIDVYGALIHVTGKGNGAVLVLHDVSELHRLERVRQDFVSNASHELKTPITAIRGILETVLDDKAMPEAIQHNFLSKAYAQTERLASIVSDLMALSRLESSLDFGSQQNQELVDINSIINQSINALRVVAEKKGVQLQIDLRDAALKIAGDSKSLRQLFDNLIDNAIKYTEAGGTVSILQKIDKERNKDCVEFQIKDTGVGISEENQSRIFERFYRVDKGRSRDSSQDLGGTGLGLAIVKHIVDQHAGSLNVDSMYGEGSTFAVSFPLA